MRENRELAKLNLERLAAMKRAGVNRVCVRISGLGDDCRACRALDRREYFIDEAPPLPPRACRCRLGCKCVFAAVR